ncbi:MAG: glycosyltransferase family 2 protein [Chloroflexi bacterium]|nr:glycosyltransferase family 2 protein [Chloroflexota bacterium]MBV9893015.1 glycosyltransferase family 2 protein [Chloroflexota bacterium]
MPRLSLVLPAFNEQARLPYTLSEVERYVCAEQLDCEVIVVDNGSRDATSVVVQQAAARFPRLRLLRTDRRGKGLAVRTGVLAAQGDVVLFADADLSWSVSDIPRFCSMVDADRPVVIGSREGFGARRLGEPGYRHLMGRVFNRVVQTLAVPGIEDSQCGFKAFTREAAQSLFQRQRLDGWGFDVEVLYLAQRLGYAITVVPLRWEHKDDSRVVPVRDALLMLADVARVRVNAWRGVYE